MNRRAELEAQFPDTELTFWDDLDAAIVGVAGRCGMEPVVCYDYDKALKCFMRRGMDQEAAQEYLEFNVVGAYVGEGTPIFLNRLITN